ncbi:unnamed protein product [Mytilus coruscus]|uniref:Uncharacterized protein n=1 Tax=Mytilus coruscus TaxID=42192 RepID=A0A6J8C7X3_MYTCO|nr:unnamed protein product [Mytilus coruscus]
MMIVLFSKGINNSLKFYTRCYATLTEPPRPYPIWLFCSPNECATGLNLQGPILYGFSVHQTNVLHDSTSKALSYMAFLFTKRMCYTTQPPRHYPIRPFCSPNECATRLNLQGPTSPNECPIPIRPFLYGFLFTKRMCYTTQPPRHYPIWLFCSPNECATRLNLQGPILYGFSVHQTNVLHDSTSKALSYKTFLFTKGCTNKRFRKTIDNYNLSYSSKQNLR